MVKTEFSIKDLENLSNVKAHTIRIWEKRYNLLEPNRTDTNIRRYDMANLKKLLNITYLYREGYKISKLAEMSSSEIYSLIKNETDTDAATYALDSLRAAMLTFDKEKFDSTIEHLLQQKNLSEIYSKIFIPLLSKTGMLWLTGTVDPSHEHFVSERIKHILITQTALSHKENPPKEFPEFVLYLPAEEVHEIGLLYANYELLHRGYRTLYLGANMEIKSLEYVIKQKPNSIFVSYFTVQPETENIPVYIEQFQKKIGNNTEFWILGDRGSTYKSKSENVRQFEKVEYFIKYLQENTLAKG